MTAGGINPPLLFLFPIICLKINPGLLVVTMKDSMLKIMQDHTTHWKVDESMIKKLKGYVARFMSKNDTHIQFFGSNLTGVHPVRFVTADRNEFLIDILDIEESSARRRVLALPNIKAHWKRPTDIFNLSCLYLAHCFRHSKLPVEKRQEGEFLSMLILNIRFITSILANSFPYPANEDYARATYSALSRRFLIKQYGSWAKTLEARAKDIVSDQSIWKDVIDDYDDDVRIVKAVNDIQTRLRSMVKLIWRVFEKIRQNDRKQMSNSDVVNLDGEMVIKDITRTLPGYKNYIHDVCMDKNTLIKAELVSIISSLMTNMSDKLVVKTLEGISQDCQKGVKDTVQWVDDIMVHAFDYIASEPQLRQRVADKELLLSKMRGMYASSRSTDPHLLKLRDHGEHIVKRHAQTQNAALIASIRTSVMLYILLRAFTKNHYS